MDLPRRRGAPLRRLARLALLLLLCTASGALAASPSRPFPQHVDYAPGSLRPAHRSQAQQDDDARALYWSWKQRYVAPAGAEADGQPRYRVKSARGADAATVSEGQGWGMLLAALMAGEDPDARSLFDGLFEFALDHPSQIDARLMDWKVRADEGPDAEGDDSAFDGDRDIATALLVAAEQWGEGRFDYAAEAALVIAALGEAALGPESRLPLLGDWVDPAGSPYSQWTPRPSDLKLDALRAFAGATGEPAWAEAVVVAQAALARAQLRHAPDTGLFPDFLEPVSAADHTLRPAAPHFLEGPYDGDFYYNALRVPLWLGMDALLHGDAVSRALARRVALWAEASTGGDPWALRGGYRLDGTPLPGSNYFTTAFAAPLAVAAMLAPEEPRWLEALYDAVKDSDEDYYEDSLALLALLVLSGNYWAPTTAALPAAGAAAPVPALGGAAHALLVATLWLTARRSLQKS